MAQIDPIPSNAPVTLASRIVSGDWYRWLSQLTSAIGSTPTTFSSQIALTNQNAAIATSNIPLPALNAGNYLVMTYARITTADGVASSLTVTAGWTETGVPLTLSGAAMTGDTIGTVQSNAWMVNVDGSTPISYRTTYSSSTAGKMHYTLRIVVQAVP